jgi:RNA polymerase sigma-70 factor (ECF subfamily)
MNEGDVPAHRNLHPAPAVAVPLEAARSQRAGAAAAPVRPDALSDGVALDFERIYVEHFQHVSRWARALGGRTADLDDLTQDVFVVVRRRISSFAGPSLAAWLYGITRKTVSDYRRRAWVRRLFSGKHRSLDALSAAEQVSGVDAVERWEARRILQRVFEQMSHVRRSAFILFEIEGYSGEEIAELEQIPVATVYTRLHHARRDFLRLTAAMTGQGAQDLPDAHEPKDPPS